MRQYVYVIGWQPEGPVKVGMAVDVKKRLATLQAGSPYKLAVLHRKQVGVHARRIERDAQYTLRDCRMLGEWFNCSVERARGVVNAWLAAYEDRFNNRHFEYLEGPWDHVMSRVKRNCAVPTLPISASPKVLSEIERSVVAAYANPAMTVEKIARKFGVTRRTVYRMLNRAGVALNRNLANAA